MLAHHGCQTVPERGVIGRRAGLSAAAKTSFVTTTQKLSINKKITKKRNVDLSTLKKHNYFAARNCFAKERILLHKQTAEYAQSV